MVSCKKCGEEKEHIDEPMVSGFVGYLCTNDNCPRDS